MPQTIKFRARSLDGELVYFSLHDVTNCFVEDGVFYVGNVPCAMGSEEQFTGLKDKNGLEIYEGDILNYRYATRKGEKVICIFDAGCFQLDFIGGHLKKPLCEVGWANLTKLGNAHENPDLLEVKL